jgi:hypothetical protein
VTIRYVESCDGFVEAESGFRERAKAPPVVLVDERHDKPRARLREELATAASQHLDPDAASSLAGDQVNRNVPTSPSTIVEP